jgi:hypothetical protein
LRQWRFRLSCRRQRSAPGLRPDDWTLAPPSAHTQWSLFIHTKVHIVNSFTWKTQSLFLISFAAKVSYLGMKKLHSVLGIKSVSYRGTKIHTGLRVLHLQLQRYLCTYNVWVTFFSRRKYYCFQETLCRLLAQNVVNFYIMTKITFEVDFMNIHFVNY